MERRKILLVEDEYSALRAFFLSLIGVYKLPYRKYEDEIRAGHSVTVGELEVFWATSVAQARGILQREVDFELLLIDRVLIGLEQGEVLMAETVGNYKVACVSADGLPDEFRTNGAMDLTKPYSLKSLQEVLHKVGLLTDAATAR